MPDVIGVRFKNCGKIYDFEVNGIEVGRGDSVVVESDLGLSIGSVVMERRSIEEPGKELKKVLRKATEEDLRQKTDNRQLEEEAMIFCIERVMARGLPMKMICTEVTLDRRRIIFYFTADGRIDFRELVKDLAARFRTRIEMRQIGVRDAAKSLGGIGICGRELCCRTFLTSFEPISIKMAKSQELVLNANKLSGLCGRLMCCLSYEYMDPDKTVAVFREEAAETGPAEPLEKDITAVAAEPADIHDETAAPAETTEAEAVQQVNGQQQPVTGQAAGEANSEQRKSGRKRRHGRRRR